MKKAVRTMCGYNLMHLSWRGVFVYFLRVIDRIFMCVAGVVLLACSMQLLTVIVFALLVIFNCIPLTTLHQLIVFWLSHKLDIFCISTLTILSFVLGVTLCIYALVGLRHLSPYTQKKKDTE